MSEPILYLMSKYSGREADSLKENQDAWLMLHRKGYLVYSPICESHNIEEYRINYNGLTRPESLPEPAYVARDLRLLEAWLKHDSECCPLGICNQIGIPCYKCPTRNHQYDSGVVGVVCGSGIYSIEKWNEFLEVGGIDKEDNIDFLRKFDPNLSKGIITEYREMKSKHILCISLETALTVPPEQWKEYGL